MGKAGAPMAKKRKKGRPSLVDLQKRALEQQERSQKQQNSKQRRFNRRNPSSAATDADDVSAEEDEYYDDDDDERKEKKVKLVGRLPQSNQQQQVSSDLVRSSSVNSGSLGSDLNAGVVNRKVNSRSGRIITDRQVEKFPKAMDNTLHGSPLESGPTTPLPDKKLLVFILDRLQKKDTHGVFSEPVDPDELPDYLEIIEQPMDFGTLRRKFDNGVYSDLEELEADLFLICSNAMQYNSSDSIYYRQAKSILELAKRDFENLRQMGDNGELQPKVVKRGRPPGKHLKKPPTKSPVEPIAPESTSGATPVTAEDNTNESTPYNLRRAPMLSKRQADSLLASHRSRNGEQYSELLSDWNEEFPAHIKRADMKYGKKHFNIDETRRDTYKQFHPSTLAQESSLLNFGGERKQLLPVGLHAENGYARSLARFAANMGPVVWKVALKKIEKALAPGVVGVGENEAPFSPPTQVFPSGSQRYMPNLATPSTSDACILNRGNVNSCSWVKTGFNKLAAAPNSGRNGGFGMFGQQGEACSWQQMNRRGFAVPADLNVGLQLQGSSAQQPDLALQL